MKARMISALVAVLLVSPASLRAAGDRWLVLEKPADGVPAKILSGVHDAVTEAFSAAETTPVTVADLLEKVPDIGERVVSPQDVAGLAEIAETRRALLIRAERKSGQLLVGMHILDAGDDLLVSIEEKVKPRTAGKTVREVLDIVLGNVPAEGGETAPPVALSPAEIEERKVAFGAHVVPLDPRVARSIKEIKNIGARVQMVAAGGNADAAGLEPNDIILSVDGKLVTSPLDVRAALAGSARTEPMTFVVWRDSTLPSLTATWGKAARRKAPKLSLGVRVRVVDQATAEAAGLPFPTGAAVVSIKKGSVAEKLGLRAGDIIVSVGGRGVDHAKNLARVTARLKSAADARVKLWRDGKELSLPSEGGTTAKANGAAVETKE